ncbi:MSHA pilin protein MshC [Aquabacterium commune]|jgi:MSHA pilin protein MshC|uniref:MSHA pilin protein MshC n=1 Tax=Aquabacterium commune TaxID=70586 RepID=A0A4R6RHY0_9BURK|nr:MULTISPECIES: type II secretion system protein [Aquabacterium]MBT9610439.1 type II secretion system protein [Aquabacterium sp.]TDP85795.1 MSHA pilin protein MshC [Aquabacterium commune]
MNKAPIARQQARGFTMVELIVTLLIVAALAATAVPVLTGGIGMRDQAWRDGALSALRHARNIATSHRRVVCASFNGNAITLTMAKRNPATACDAPLASPDGKAVFASSNNSEATTAVTLVSGSAFAGTFHFQPDSRITTDFAGTATGQWRVVLTGADDIAIDGVTGHVR